jgi:uncharacterized membrane protein YqjE
LVALSFVDVAFGLPLPGRAGFFWAALAFVVAAVLDRDALGDRLGSNRPLLVAAGAVAASRVLSAAIADAGLPAWADVARVALCGGVLVLFAIRDQQDDDAHREALARVGMVLLVALALLFVAGAASPSLKGTLFEAGSHSVAGARPRFLGWSDHPMACGVLALQAIVLTQLSARAQLRRAGALVGLGVCVVTASFAAACAVLALVGRARRPLVRRALGAVVVAAALSVLWVHPLRVEVLGRELVDRPPPPAWYEAGKGARHLPVFDVDARLLRVRGYATGYGRLAARGLDCFVGSPVFGVGARDFSRDCPVEALNSHGRWSRHRDPHNAWTGALAEHGLVGLALLIVALAVVARRYRFVAQREVTWSLLACLLAGFGGMRPWQIVLAVVVGLSLVARQERSATTRAPAATRPTGSPADSAP